MHKARAYLENFPPTYVLGNCRYLSGPGCPPTCSSRTDGQLRFERWDPGLAETDGSLYFTCREDNETLCHFVFDCPTFKPNFDSLWCKLLLKASNLHAADGIQISQFITNLDRFHKTLLLLGCLHLPFDNTTVTLINNFIASAVAKIYKIRTENLHELESLWLLNVSVNSKPDHPPGRPPGIRTF